MSCVDVGSERLIWYKVTGGPTPGCCADVHPEQRLAGREPLAALGVGGDGKPLVVVDPGDSLTSNQVPVCCACGLPGLVTSNTTKVRSSPAADTLANEVPGGRSKVAIVFPVSESPTSRSMTESMLEPVGESAT